MSDTTFNLAIAVSLGITGFLLAQPDVTLPPIAKLVLGAIQIGLGIIAARRDPVADPTE